VSTLCFVLKWIRFRIRLAVGIVYNLAGVPGLVRNCDYEAGVTDALIKVRVHDIHTIIQVNGLDIYFHRLTGSIDGVGFMSCCRSERVPASASLPVVSEPPPCTPQTSSE